MNARSAEARTSLGEVAMRDAVIVGAVRTAVGRKGGRLAGVRPDDLAAHVLRALVERVGVDPSEVEDVVLGCVDQLGEQGFNIARNAALIAGFPLDVCGTTLDRMCGSGQQAANFADMGVMAGQYECVIAGGVEHMTRVPMGSDGSGPGEGPLSPRLQALYTIIPPGRSGSPPAPGSWLPRWRGWTPPSCSRGPSRPPSGCSGRPGSSSSRWTSSRSTRPSPPWCWPGSGSSTPIWTGSTSTAGPSPSGIRWAAPAPVS